MRTAAPPSRFRRNLWIATVLFGFFTIIGFLVVPPVVKAQLQKRLSAELGRTVTVGKVRFNPYALSLTLENFDIKSKEGNRSFLGWNRLYLNFDAVASLTGDWVLGAIELNGFHADAIVMPDGSLSFSDIIAKLNAAPDKPASSKPSRPIRFGSIKVTQARVDFSDQSRPTAFATVVGPLTFSLTEFRTAGGRGAPYHFEAVTEAGEKVAWTGTISAQPLRSVGELSVENLVLAKYAPYYSDRVQADVSEGKLSLRGRYEMDLTENPRVLKLVDGVVQLRGLKVFERTGHDAAVELPALDIMGVNADAFAQRATVGSVSLSGGRVRVRREKDGAVNLVTMFVPAGTKTAANPAPSVSVGAPGSVPAPAQSPDIRIGDISLKDFQVEISDLAAPRPADLKITGIQFSLSDVTLADGAVMPLQLSLGWAPQGTVRVEGTVSIKPSVKAELKTEVADLALLPLSPYLEQFINARLTQGAVTTTLATEISITAGQPLAANVTGEVKVDKFGLVDGAHNEELAGVGSLQLKGLKVATAPRLSLALDEVVLTGLYARVVINNDKTLNLSMLARASEKPASPPPPLTVALGEPTVATGPKITIGRVVLNEGDFSFSDRSVEPNVRLAINQFRGTVSGLSSENLAKAGVDLKAMVDGAGPVAITGQLDPLGARKFVDLKVDLRNVDLQPLSPYSGKFAGYELARGKLLLDVKFLLDDKKLDATNVVTLNQFTFGAPVKSPDATGLPVRLGVALLKDIDGKIVVDVPIQGSTDDPNFRIGKVVLRVIVNLLTKVATSPFSLLGSMFGGGGDELAFQEFTPGAATLQPEEVKKLDTMVKALTNRPGLSLSLEGSFDGPADTYALKQQKLVETVRRAVWEQKHAISPNIPSPEALVITPEENAAMTKQLFEAKFPTGTEFATAVTKAPEVEAPPEPEKRGIFGRVVDVVTFKGLRHGKSDSKKAVQPPPPEPKVADVATSVPVGPPLEEMTGRLAESMDVGENDLRALAASRAKQVRDYFITTGKINPERLFLANANTDPAKTGKGPRVFLNLQ